LFQNNREAAVAKLKITLEGEIEHLLDVWPSELDIKSLSNLRRHAHFGEQHDFDDMHEGDIPSLEDLLDTFFSQNASFETVTSILHPKVIEHSIHHFEDGDYREAVLNAMLALRDAIRRRSKLDRDGADLASHAFRPEAPRLVFSEVRTQTGRDDQDGFHQIMRGAFIGIRNPKAHELQSDLTSETAAQYLVLISLLLRRVEECKTQRVRSRLPKRNKEKIKPNV